MSTTIIDNVQEEGATTPTGPFLRVIAGINEDTNVVKQIQAYPDGGLSVGPSFNSSTTFGRLRVDESTGIFDNKQIYAKDTLFWVESLVTGATSTFLTNESAVQLETTTTSGSSVTRQTRQYMPHQPGCSQLMFITGLMGGLKANVRQRIGLFDDNNGIFFEQDGTNLKVVRRTFVTGVVVDNAVNQSAWNLDMLDGTGRSGYNLDTTKVQNFIIDFSWLGVGLIRLGILNGASAAYCHQFLLANTLTTVWAQTPVLPVRFELTNTAGTASITTMKQISTSVISEGGLDPVGLIVGASTGTAGITVTITETPLLGLRLSSTYNRSTVIPLTFEIMSSGTNDLLIRIWMRATVSGGSWVASSGVATEVNINPTGLSTTGAVLITNTYISTMSQRVSGGTIRSSLSLCSDFAGTADQLIITAQNVLVGNNTTYAALHWKELY